jgi:hypothetical protein
VRHELVDATTLRFDDDVVLCLFRWQSSYH